MGYMDQREIPNYWTWASEFVLADHMFEPNASWSLPAHLFMVSGWSARCTNPADPMSCVSDIKQPGLPTTANPQPYAWTDLTYLLYKNKVSWGYYLQSGTGARLPGQRDAVHAGPAESQRAEHLEPAAGLRRRQGRRPARERPAHGRLLLPLPKTARSRP